MLNIPASINDEVVSTFAKGNGYQETVVITPASPGSPETISYDQNTDPPTPITVPAVPPTDEVTGPNPQSAEDFVTELLTNQMLQAYKQAAIDVVVKDAQEQAKKLVDDATEQASQTVEAAISTAKQNAL